LRNDRYRRGIESLASQTSSAALQPRLRCASFGMTAIGSNKEAPPVSRRGPLSNSPNYRVIVMQQAPGQQAPPPQQPASLDEIVVALVSVVIAAIKSRYFMILSC
jgi:hypothetical protein